jgi:hypothetical protein
VKTIKIKLIQLMLIACTLLIILNSAPSPIFAQGGSVSGSNGTPQDSYLEFTLTGADLKLREGTTNHYDGPWTGGPITLSGKMIVDRIITDTAKGGTSTYVRFFGYLHDQNKDLNHYFKWPEDEEMRLVANRVETQEASITYIVPSGYNEPTVKGSIVVELCGQSCKRNDFFFEITIPPDVLNPPIADEPIPAQKAEDPCPQLTSTEKINQILSLYYTKIPNGITTSGTKNNILYMTKRAIGFRGTDNEYDRFLCGGYQSAVIDLLARIKFSDDPCQAALMEDFDYGPIQAWWGGHQAVVLYPKGTDWMITGIVLDPWINQSPKEYSFADWMSRMDAKVKNTPDGYILDNVYPHIGPSEAFKKIDSNYPIFGGTYQPPGDIKYTEAESEYYINNTTDAEKLHLRGLTKIEQKKWLQEKMATKEKLRKIVAHCPVNLHLLGPDGGRSGITSNHIFNDLLDVTFMQIPLNDGTTYTELTYPADAPYTLFIEGVGNGQAHVFIGEDPDSEGQISPLYLYTFMAEAGKLYQVAMDYLGAPMISDGFVLQPNTIGSDDDLSWILGLPAPLEISEGEDETHLPFALPKIISNPPLWMGVVILLFGLAGLGLFTFLVFIRALNKQEVTKPSTKMVRLVLLAGLLSVACLVSLCGVGGLYLNLSQPQTGADLTLLDQPQINLAQTEAALGFQQTQIALALQATAMAQPTDVAIITDEPAEAVPPTITPTEQPVDVPEPTAELSSPDKPLTGAQYLTEHGFVDDFSSDALGWPVKDDGVTVLRYENEAYRFILQEKRGFEAVYLPVEFHPKDILFDIQGPSNAHEGTFGVICQLQDAENYYYVDFDLQAGQYAIQQVLNGELVSLTTGSDYWHSSSAFNQPATVVNRIYVGCYLGDIQLNINDEVVDIVFIEQPFPKTGRAAFFLFTYEYMSDPNFQVLIDNVEAYDPVQ